MGASLTRCEGFESLNLSANSFGGVNGQGLLDVINRPAGVILDQEHARTGGASLHVICDGLTTTNAQMGFTPSQIRVVSLYFLAEVPPASTSFMFCMPGPTNLPGITLRSDGTIMSFVVTDGPIGPNVVDGNWHLVDVLFKTNSTTYTIDWMVDGVPQTQDDATGQTAQNMTDLVLGSIAASNTCDVWFDDVLMSETASDYPLGSHRVYVFFPNADAEHVAGTNVIEDQTGADIGIVPAWSLLNDSPAGTGGYVQQVAVGAGNYAEVNFSDAPEYFGYDDILGVEAQAALFSAGANPNNGTTRIVNVIGSTLATLYTADMSETTLHYVRIIVGSGEPLWHTGLFNELQARMGMSTDVDSVPRWSAINLQVAVHPEKGVPSAVSHPMRW